MELIHTAASMDSSWVIPEMVAHSRTFNDSTECLVTPQRLYRMFNDPSREDQVEMYLLNANKKGPKFVDEFWYDNLALKCHCQNPTGSSYAVMLEVQSLLGDNIQAPSESTIRKCLLRNKMQMNRASYVSFL